MIFEQGASRFHFALSPTNHVTDPHQCYLHFLGEEEQVAQGHTARKGWSRDPNSDSTAHIHEIDLPMPGQFLQVGSRYSSPSPALHSSAYHVALTPTSAEFLDAKQQKPTLAN